MEDYTKSQAVVLMAKAPLPGRVKTRLIAFLGKTGAARLAECMLLDRVESLRGISGKIFLAFAPESARGYFREKCRRTYRLLSQGRGSLGERLSRIARKLFSQGFVPPPSLVPTAQRLRRCEGGGIARIVFVGYDSPLMRLSIIRQAFRELRSGKDMVISPAQDGGYVLIGMRYAGCGMRKALGIFQGIPWGGQAVFKATLLRARRLRLKIGILPKGFDVDVPLDLEKLKRSLRRRRAYSPRVFDFLTHLRGL